MTFRRVDYLPETRGGAREPRLADGFHAACVAEPGVWFVAFEQGLRSWRMWLSRRYPDLQVATRTMPGNEPGKVTIYARVPMR